MSKLELKQKAESLKEAGVNERYSIDWEATGITYLGGIDVKKEYVGKKSPFKVEEVKKAK